MPDDETLEQEIAEQPDPDAMVGFDLGAKDDDKPSEQDGEKPPEEKKDTDKPKEDKPPEKEDKPPEKEDKPPEKKPDEKLDKDGKPEKEAEPKKDEDLTAKDRIDQRVKEFEPLEDKSPKKEAELEKPAEEESPPPEKLGRLTKERIADHLRAIPDDILPDETVFIGDAEINLKEFADEFPEQFAAVKVLSGVIAQQAINKALEGQKPDEDTQKRLDDQDALIHSLLWWDDVTQKHSDAKQVKSSKEFQAWFDDQPDNIKRFGAGEVLPEDAILLLDFYKEDVAKKAVKKHDDTAQDKKKLTDDLHKGTMRAKNDTGTQGDTDMEDDEAGFEEGVKEFD